MTAQLGFIDEIEGPIAKASRGRRSEMLRKMTDLFINGADQFTGEDISVFDGVLGRLATEIELSARELLAKQLARFEIRRRRSFALWPSTTRLL